jgi:hypothetical protein
MPHYQNINEHQHQVIIRNFVIAYVVDVIMCMNWYIMCYMMGMKIKCNKGECSQKSKFGKIIIFGQMHINMSKKVILLKPLHQS